jgi:hypothetical protein
METRYLEYLNSYCETIPIVGACNVLVGVDIEEYFEGL